MLVKGATVLKLGNTWVLVYHIIQWIWLTIHNTTLVIIPKGSLDETTGWTWQWRHNWLDSVSNHQPHHCLLSRLFGCRLKKASKPRVTGLLPVNSPHKWPVTQKMFPFDDVIKEHSATIVILNTDCKHSTKHYTVTFYPKESTTV